MEGRVIQSTGSWYEVLLTNGKTISCRLKGKFRLEDKKLTNPIAVGDIVDVNTDDDDGSMVINTIFERKNYLVREAPHKTEHKHIIASNIDQIVVIATLSKPRTSAGFIDRVLLTAEVYGVPAFVIFNKYDQCTDQEIETVADLELMYTEIGYSAFHTSIITGECVDQLKAVLTNKITVLTGHSGVGKSSLVNYMQPKFDLKVNEISKYHDKGMHTTTFARMMALSFGGFIIDTPGIKEFGMVDISPQELGHYFPEIRSRMNQCKFNNCLHLDENECAVKMAFERHEIAFTRYLNYVSIYEEIMGKKKW